jgi:photosystem II stability/assembly factor-like uncharacterized protein
MFFRFAKSQTASEYLVVVSVVLLIAISIATTLGSFDWFGSPAKNLASAFEPIGLLSVTVYENYTSFVFLNNVDQPIKLQSLTNLYGSCSYVGGARSIQAGGQGVVSYVCSNHSSFYGSSSVGKVFSDVFVIMYSVLDSGAQYTVEVGFDIRGWDNYPVSYMTPSQPISLELEEIPFAVGSQTTFTDLAVSYTGKYYSIVFSENTILRSNTSGVNWSSVGPIKQWTGIDMDYSGFIQVASAQNDYLYLSQNTGINWTPIGFILNWTDVSISSDGRVIIGVAQNSGIFISSDFGQTWFNYSLAVPLSSVSSNYDGTVITAVSLNGFIYTSNTSGTTFSQYSLLKNWTSVDMTADGKVQFATSFDSYIYTSFNYGLNWSNYSSQIDDFKDISVSANGSLAIAIPGSGTMQVSVTNGSTWYSSGSSTSYNNIGVSSDGTRRYVHSSFGSDCGTNLDYLSMKFSNSSTVSHGQQLTWTALEENNCFFSQAVSYNGSFILVSQYRNSNPVLRSFDYGRTWMRHASQKCDGVAMSYTGQYVSCVLWNGYVYTSSDYGATYGTNTSQQSYLFTSMSSNGTYQLAPTHWGSSTYVSNDSGITWYSKPYSSGFQESDISETGQYQVMISNSGVYISSDYGNTFSTSPSTSSAEQYSVRITSDGSKIYYGSYNGYIKMSNNSGVSWTNLGILSDYSRMSISSNGSFITAVAKGILVRSADGGLTWSNVTNFRRRYSYIDMSADGVYQIATVPGGHIWLSNDTGLTWFPVRNLP